MTYFNRFALTVMTFLMVSGCGKVVVIDPGEIQSAVESDHFSCSSDRTREWRFTQSQLGQGNRVDLLLVVDTSLSLLLEREKITNRISDFLKGLPSGADYQIAVLPGHGPLSSLSARLFSREEGFKVLKSSELTSEEIVKRLHENLDCLPLDLTPGGGEYLFYSFLNATQGEQLKRIKREGFLRDGADLSVAFISDENEICFDPKKHGFRHAPDYVPSILGDEELGYDLFCVDHKTHQEKYTSSDVLERLDSLMGPGHYSVGSIAHFDPHKVPRGEFFEDSIGHGYLELIEAAHQGIKIEITQHSYTNELGTLLGLTTLLNSLQTQFTLGSLTAAELATLSVQVDNSPVHFTLSGEVDVSTQVELLEQNAGHPGSAIWIRACTAPAPVPNF